jgi:hypothetical protein
LCQHTASAGLEKTSKFDKIDTGRMVYIQVTVGVGFFLINCDKAKLPIVEPIMGNFFLNELLWICAGNASPRYFVHRKDI